MLTSREQLDILAQLKLAKNSAIKIESQEERRTDRDNHRTHNISMQHTDITQQQQQTQVYPDFALLLNRLLCNNSTET